MRRERARPQGPLTVSLSLANSRRCFTVSEILVPSRPANAMCPSSKSPKSPRSPAAVNYRPHQQVLDNGDGALARRTHPHSRSGGRNVLAHEGRNYLLKLGHNE